MTATTLECRTDAGSSYQCRIEGQAAVPKIPTDEDIFAMYVELHENLPGSEFLSKYRFANAVEIDVCTEKHIAVGQIRHSSGNDTTMANSQGIADRFADYIASEEGPAAQKFSFSIIMSSIADLNAVLDAASGILEILPDHVKNYRFWKCTAGRGLFWESRASMAR